MEPVAGKNKQSILNKIRSIIAHSILYNILINKQSGIDCMDEDTRLESLATQTGTSLEKMESIDSAFNSNNKRINELEKEISNFSNNRKNRKDSFRVDESDLSYTELDTKTVSTHSSQKNKKSDREIGG